MKKILSVALATVMLASSICYAADSTVTADSTAKFERGNRSQMHFEGKMGGRGFGEKSIANCLEGKELTDVQKAKVETVKANETTIKELREKIREKASKTQNITGDRRGFRGNMANLTDEQKEKMQAVKGSICGIADGTVGKYLTTEERAEKMLADIDNIVTKQNEKIKALQDILADL